MLYIVRVHGSHHRVERFLDLRNHFKKSIGLFLYSKCTIIDQFTTVQTDYFSLEEVEICLSVAFVKNDLLDGRIFSLATLIDLRLVSR